MDSVIIIISFKTCLAGTEKAFQFDKMIEIT